MFRISEAATVIAVASNLDSVCQALPVSSYKNTLGRQWQTMGMAVTEGIEMQQVGQDMTCNSDDRIVNAKVNHNKSLSYHQLLYHEDLSE